MIFVWITILILTLLILIFKRNNITFGFFGSSLLTLISYLIFKNFIIQLIIFVISGIIGSIIFNKLKKFTI